MPESIDWNKETDLSDDEEASLTDVDSDAVEIAIDDHNHSTLEESSDIAVSAVDSALTVTSEAIDDAVQGLDEIAPAAQDTNSIFRSQPSGDIIVWEARKGANVRRVLEKWAQTENVDFSWAGSEKYKVNKDVFISGTFSNAVEILLSTSVNNAPQYSFSQDNAYRLLVDGE